MLENRIHQPHSQPSYQRRCQQPRAFGSGNPLAERNTLRVVVLTAVMMVVEIICGMLFNSMALLADGWHMGTHAVALGISALAYIYARRFAHDARFAFGTWKIEVLGGYTSAILLALVALVMAYESVSRLLRPTAIRFDEAIAVAVIGLAVNVVCAWLLNHGQRKHDESGRHDESHAHGHEHDVHHHDLNLRSAYLHVIADASTSVLAILALLGGKFWGAGWLDPMMGIVGAVLVAVWAYGLIRDTAHALLDAEMNTPLVQDIQRTIEQGGWQAQIRDLHVWRVGNGKYACILAIATASEVSVDEVRGRLNAHHDLAHVSVEVIRVAAPTSAADCANQQLV